MKKTITSDICATCRKCCEGTLLGNSPCLNYRATGCIGLWKDRDEGCKAFPFVIIQDERFKNQRRVFIDTACPHWREFGEKLEDLEKLKLGPTIFLRI